MQTHYVKRTKDIARKRYLPDAGAALLIAGLSAAAMLSARLAWPFDGLYGQDAFAYFRYARALWPWLLRGEPLPIYYWPAGYPLLVALLLPLAGWSSGAGQAVSMFASAASAALTYALARELLPDVPGGRLAAWAAGLAVALASATLRAGLVAMSDATAMACCVAATYALARYMRTRRSGWLALAALALAWAIITRWVCGLLALPLLAFYLAELRAATRQSASSQPTLASHNLPAIILASGLGALIVIPQLLVSQTTPAALSQHQWVTAWSIANAWRRDFTTVDGTQHYALPVGAYYLARMAWVEYIGPPLALACLPGTLWLARQRRWPALLVLVGWPLLLWLFLSGIPYQNARFLLPALPALAVLAGLGFGWAYARASTLLRAALLLALASSLLGSIAWSLRDYRQLVAYKNDQLALVAWTGAQLPAGGTLITFGATLTLQHYSDYDVRELYYLGPPELDAIARMGRPVYLLLDVGNAESQWAGLRPQLDYHYLQQQPGLEIIGTHAPYTLFHLKQR